jgi:hypothetical protein
MRKPTIGRPALSNSHFIAGREEVEAAGGKVLALSLEPGFSTTNIEKELLARVDPLAASASKP